MPPLIELQHVSVGEFESWEFDPRRRLIMLRAIIDKTVTDADVSVAVAERPRFGARLIKRHESGIWEVTALRCGSEAPKPVHPRIGFRSVLLLGAPSEVQTELLVTL